jgi:hypothetical protein
LKLNQLTVIKKVLVINYRNAQQILSFLDGSSCLSLMARRCIQMNKKTIFGLSAIVFILIGMLAFSYRTGPYGGRSLNNQGGSVLRSDAPLPPLPWPWGLSLPSDASVS